MCRSIVAQSMIRKDSPLYPQLHQMLYISSKTYSLQQHNDLARACLKEVNQRAVPQDSPMSNVFPSECKEQIYYSLKPRKRLHIQSNPVSAEELVPLSDLNQHEWIYQLAKSNCLHFRFCLVRPCCLLKKVSHSASQIDEDQNMPFWRCCSHNKRGTLDNGKPSCWVYGKHLFESHTWLSNFL